MACQFSSFPYHADGCTLVEIPDETPTDPKRCWGSANLGDISFASTVGTLERVLGFHLGLLLEEADIGIGICLFVCLMVFFTFQLPLLKF